MNWLRSLLGLPDAASSYAASVDALHAFIILTTMFGALAIAVVALIFTWRYRQRGARPSITPRVVSSRRFEIAVIGSLTMLFVLWWWIGYRQFLRIQTPPDDAIDVFVTAKQWMWQFAYPDGRASIAVLVVPAGRPVRLIMVSRDVIHSFYVPDFRLKHDVLPGRTSLAWFQANAPGSHQLLCAEYCGLEHSRMRGQIVALAPADYAAWRDGSTPTPVAEALELARADQALATIGTRSAIGDLPTQGMAVAARHGCLACHTTDGQRHIGPSWQGLFGSEVMLQDGRRLVADEAYLTESMMDPSAKIVAGYSPVMPSYQGLLEPDDAALLVALIKSLHPGAPSPQSLPVLPPATAQPPSTTNP